ncbi:MAG: EAL domain-containing protein [Pseudomonadota bacterium]
MSAQAVRLSNVDINKALENKDFEVLFQPIFDLGNGALARMETFVRWRHESLGILPPGAFLSFFESQGRMSELTRYVLANALDAYAAWRGPYSPGFSINLALSDMIDDAFAPHFTKLLRDKSFPTDLITLECPMPPIDGDIEALSANLAKLRETGARMAIEVRGRANDFLRTIDPFPFDEIKTGGSSILRFARTVRGPGLSAISDLLDIANRANAVITAVGVEDQASLAALRGLGFTAAQGNHLAKVGALSEFRPTRVNDVRALLELAPLGPDELSALFRTGAPEPRAAETGPADNTGGESPPKASPPDQNEETAEAAEQAPSAADDETERKAAEREALVARARKKARAIALAKRARAREARKAAAIKRARAKAAQRNETESASTVSDEMATASDRENASQTGEATPEAAPRAMQERIATEFVESGAKAAAKTSVDATEQDIAHDQKDAPPTKPKGASDHSDDASAADPAESQGKEPVASPDREPAALDSEAKTSAESAQPGVSGEVDETVPTDDDKPQNQLTGKVKRLSLSVGKVRTFFAPGILVSGTPDTVGPSAPLQRADPAPREPLQPAARDTEQFVPPAVDLGAKEEQGTLFSEASEVEASEDAKPEETPAPAVAAAPAARRSTRPRERSFLTRRYRLTPTHFWPRSWKRAWRKRHHEKQADAERD